jgi:hypothetical protein
MGRGFCVFGSSLAGGDAVTGATILPVPRHQLALELLLVAGERHAHVLAMQLFQALAIIVRSRDTGRDAQEQTGTQHPPGMTAEYNGRSLH